MMHVYGYFKPVVMLMHALSDITGEPYSGVMYY